MDAVNLLPLEYRDRKRGRLAAAEGLDGRQSLKLGGIVTLLFAALVAGLYLHERSVVHDKQKHLAATQGRVAAIQPQVQAIKAAQAATAARLAAAQAITSSRMNWDRALNDFARVVPTNSYLTSLQIAAPVPTASAATAATTPGATPSTTTPTALSTLSVSGIAPSTVGVALVMDRLILLPWLDGVSLQTAARQADGTNTFTVTAGVGEAH